MRREKEKGAKRNKKIPSEYSKLKESPKKITHNPDIIRN